MHALQWGRGWIKEGTQSGAIAAHGETRVACTRVAVVELVQHDWVLGVSGMKANRGDGESERRERLRVPQGPGVGHLERCPCCYGCWKDRTGRDHQEVQIQMPFPIALEMWVSEPWTAGSVSLEFRRGVPRGDRNREPSAHRWV